MDQRHAELYRRIMNFPLDEPGASLTFTARLARENGWSQAFARRVLDEYRRFAFLAVEAGHPVAPSDEVDQAWHLHLTYTRSYWRGFCALLGRPLHHQPTRGGRDELEKHVDWYERTLASYRRLFQCEPPADIWPPADERFQDAAAYRRINLQRYWTIPKPDWRRVGSAVLLAGAVAPLAALANPFNLAGPQFLILYAILFAVALAFALVVQFILRGGQASEIDSQLDAYETACLALDARQAIRAATAALVQQGTLEVRRTSAKVWGILPGAEQYLFVAAQPLRADAAPLERAVRKAAGAAGATMLQIYQAAGDEAERLSGRLQDAGLVLPPLQAAKVRWFPALIVASVAGLGAVKIAVGISRGRPVGFLAAAVIATLVVAGMFVSRSARSRSGDRLVSRLKQQHASLARSDYTGVPAEQLALAIALFGAAILAGGALDEVRNAFGAAAKHGGGCSTGCGSGCGGGCGGCGGCS